MIYNCYLRRFSATWSSRFRGRAIRTGPIRRVAGTVPRCGPVSDSLRSWIRSAVPVLPSGTDPPAATSQHLFIEYLISDFIL